MFLRNKVKIREMWCTLDIWYFFISGKKVKTLYNQREKRRTVYGDGTKLLKFCTLYLSHVSKFQNTNSFWTPTPSEATCKEFYFCYLVPTHMARFRIKLPETISNFKARCLAPTFGMLNPNFEGRFFRWVVPT